MSNVSLSECLPDECVSTPAGLDNHLSKEYHHSPNHVTFSANFENFLHANHVSVDDYNLKKLFRFVRINERALNNNDNLDDLIDQLRHDMALQFASNDVREAPDKIEIEPVNWFSSLGHRFLKFEAKYNICATGPYKLAQIYGIDASSAAVVVALDVQVGQHVLDLCCAPGAKLAMIIDTLTTCQAKFPTELKSTVTGVDISLKRLAVCETTIRKYKLKQVRLFSADACTFSVLAPNFIIQQSDSTAEQKTVISEAKERFFHPFISLPPIQFPADVGQPIPRESGSNQQVSDATKKKKTKKHCHRLEGLYYLSDWSWSQSSSQLYDRVLVDAQCTLDASMRHLLYYNKEGCIGGEEPVKNTSVLQKRLIYNGFRLLKPGGALVYSTCSFCLDQNEGVVEWLLKQEENAYLMSISWPEEMVIQVNEGRIPETKMLYPKVTGTSGGFIAKIGKH